MGEYLTVRDLGEGGVTSVTALVACMRCGGDLTAVATDQPRGTIVRGRRVSLDCASPSCHWSGVLVFEIVEMSNGAPRGRGVRSP